MPFPLWPTAFVVPLGLCFLHFFYAGQRTFRYGPEDDLGAGLAQLSFLGTGALGTMFLGYRAEVPPANAAAGALIMMAALALYEWARRTVRERGFAIAWSDQVPESVCETGPYRQVRHPVYASYLLAFAAQFAALPGWWTAAILAFNLVLFVHAARHDERSLARSDMAEAYRGYRERTGMFLPRLPLPVWRGG